MLVIGRRASEPIVMARDVEIEVLESSPTRACWASARPKQVLVVRKELGISADENRAASHNALHLLAPLVTQQHAPPEPARIRPRP
jgi:sRNA-binding carbon storage regulator CsrA